MDSKNVSTFDRERNILICIVRQNVSCRVIEVIFILILLRVRQPTIYIVERAHELKQFYLKHLQLYIELLEQVAS